MRVPLIAGMLLWHRQGGLAACRVAFRVSRLAEQYTARRLALASGIGLSRQA